MSFPETVLEDNGTFSGRLFSKIYGKEILSCFIPVGIGENLSITQLHMLCSVQEVSFSDQFKVLHILFEAI